MEIFLALNRCIEIGFSRISERLFEGWRTWLWMFPPVLYGFYVFFIEKPVVFTGLFFAWFFYPHVGYLNESVEAQIVSHQDQFLCNRNRVIVATSLSEIISQFFSTTEAIYFLFTIGSLCLLYQLLISALESCSAIRLVDCKGPSLFAKVGKMQIAKWMLKLLATSNENGSLSFYGEFLTI